MQGEEKITKGKHNELSCGSITGDSLDMSAEPVNRDFSTVSYANLAEWLKSKASSTEIHYIRVTDIPESALIGELCILKAGNLGQILKESGKKVFIQIELEDGKVLKGIGAGAFYKVKNLAGIELPEGLISIGIGAFSDCSDLTSINLPESLTIIWIGAFAGCSGLTSISLPESLASIGHEAFYGCNGLINIILPEGLTSIEEGAFWNCSGLTSISLPETLTSLGDWAFDGCKRVIVPNNRIKKLVIDSDFPEDLITVK